MCGRGGLRRSAAAQRRGPAPGVGASASRLEPADTQCTAARRSERFSTLMNGLMWGWLLAIVTAAFVGGR